MADSSRLTQRLEAAMFGEYERQYRLFARAVTVVAVALTLAWGIFALGLLPLGPGATSVLGTAAGVAVAAFVVVGLLQFLVLANVLERSHESVATEAAELEAAAEELEAAAEELESTAQTVEDAAADVDGAAEETGVTDAQRRADDAKRTAESVTEEVEAARETATEVEETAAEKRERLAEGDDGSADG